MSDFEKPQSENPDTGWERRLLEQLALETLKEQKRRRWGIFFKFTFLLLFWERYTIFQNFSDATENPGPHTALVEIERLYRC
jgi:protease-4